jgi:hypothetical protein
MASKGASYHFKLSGIPSQEKTSGGSRSVKRNEVFEGSGKKGEGFVDVDVC